MTQKPERTRVAAYGLLTKHSQILLCRISDQLPHHHGKWTLPGGGVEFGETPAQAAVREFEEETGLVVAIDQLVDVDSAVVETPDTVFHSIRILYSVTDIGGELRNESDGTTDLCRWWSADTLPEMVDLAIKGTAIAFDQRIPT